VLGQAAVGGKAKTYVDWKGRLLTMGRAEAKALGLPWATVMRWKRRLRVGFPIENRHGGRAMRRVMAILPAREPPLPLAVDERPPKSSSESGPSLHALS
jgi:hypothetical protein